MNSAFLLMVDPCSVPTTHGQHIRIFNLHDGIQQIVGYCIPIKQCVGLFRTIPKARVIKTVDTVASSGDQLLTKFKFVYPPLNVVPMNEEEFQEMIKSPPLPFRGPNTRNRFYVRPTPQSPTQKRPQFEDSAMN
uniref:Major sperm protein n=1 Tax=Meloidogyne hapla TaxID=6305 RepID=A0A1I8C184_MELHA